MKERTVLQNAGNVLIKIFGIVFLGILFCFMLVSGNKNLSSVKAAGYVVQDGAFLFTDEERQMLERKAQQISDEFDTGVLILTSLEVMTSDNYARDLIESAGESQFSDGYIGLAVNMADRSYWVDAYGDREREIFRQSQTDELAEEAAEKLADGDYYQAADGFLDAIEKRLIVKASPNGRWKKPFVYPGATFGMLAGSGIFALIFAFLWTAWRSAGHKDKQEAMQADAYRSDLQLMRRNARFSHHYQTRVKVANESSSGSHSGGGGSAGHTGSGGHF